MPSPYAPDRALTQLLASHASAAGASLVGFADLSSLAELPRAVVIAKAHSQGVLSDLEGMPTPEYYQEYLDFNSMLDRIAGGLASALEASGHRARVNATTLGVLDPATLSAPFSHKMAATRAGLGWIGKSALLVTPELGPALRLTSILTDAPLSVGTPVTASSCGTCTACREICPGRAISGKEWSPGLPREQFFDAFACREACLARARPRGIDSTICGLCMAVCPKRPR